MEPNNENQNKEFANERNQIDKAGVDKIHYHMNKSVISRIIVVCISLMLAMSLGYVLYAQLLSQKGDVTPSESDGTQSGVQEPGFDMSTFDENDIESRQAMLEFISNQNEEGEGLEEETILAEDREAVLESISLQEDDGVEEETIPAEDREAILETIDTKQEDYSEVD